MTLRVRDLHAGEAEELVKTFSVPRPGSDKPDDVQGIPLRIGAGFWLGGNTQPENLVVHPLNQ